MVREARLLWDNPALRPDDADRLRRLEQGRDSSSRKPRRRNRPKPSSAEKPTLDGHRPTTSAQKKKST